MEITIREQQRKLLYEESRRREKFRRQKIIYLPVLKDVEWFGDETIGYLFGDCLGHEW